MTKRNIFNQFSYFISFSDGPFRAEPEGTLHVLLQAEPASLSGHLRDLGRVQQPLPGLQLFHQLRHLLRHQKVV
jgi:hypothetical protein